MLAACATGGGPQSQQMLNAIYHVDFMDLFYQMKRPAATYLRFCGVKCGVLVIQPSGLG
jgi:hypothetical protein